MTISLPRDDANPAARRSALETRRHEYAFTTFNDLPIGREFHDRDKAGPLWVKQLLSLIRDSRANLESYLKVSGRTFSTPLPSLSILELTRALARKDFTTLLNHYLPDLGCMDGGGRAGSIEEYRRIFQNEPLPKIADVFMEDWVFARTFVAGPNPFLLRRLDAPLASFPVTDEQFRSQGAFQNDSLHRAIAEERVYLVDYRALGVLRGGRHPQQPKFVTAPQVMLALPRARRSLVPIAIGAERAGAPIWTPCAGWAWQIAKQAARAADGCHQELLSHLGFTHLIIEPFVVATRRNLSHAHPLYVLLDPHFEGTMPINALAVKKLIQPGEAVDRLLGADVPSMYELLRRERLAFSFKERCLPADLQARQVDDAVHLPDYPYRDDALKVWRSIERWVSGYTDHYYRDDRAVAEDEELQGWVRELADPSQGAVKDLGRDGGIVDRAALKEVLTMVIFTASAQHAAANFAQKTDMAFAPAHPLALYAPLRGEEATLDEQDFVDTLPPLDVALRTEQTLIFLGSLHHGQLGHYPALHFRDRHVSALLRRFRSELAEIEAQIIERNRELVLPYVHLQPTRIPQSINI
jgi:arachidonate 15-lipoxygenase